MVTEKQPDTLIYRRFVIENLIYEALLKYNNIISK